MQGLGAAIGFVGDRLKAWQAEMASQGAFWATLAGGGSIDDAFAARQRELDKQNQINPAKPYAEFTPAMSEAAKDQAAWEENAKRMEEAARKAREEREKERATWKASGDSSDFEAAATKASVASELAMLERRKDIIKATAEAEIEGKKIALQLAEQQTTIAEAQLKMVSGMLNEMKVISLMPGRADLQRAEFERQRLMREAGLDRQAAADMERAQRAAQAFSDKEANRARNQRDAEREQRRLEREGKALSEAQRRRERAEVDEDFAKRGIRGVGKKGEEALERLDKIKAQKEQEQQRAREDKQRAEDDLRKAQEDRDKRLSDIAESTKTTAERLKLITSR
jgi:hypothetical protein